MFFDNFFFFSFKWLTWNIFLIVYYNIIIIIQRIIRILLYEKKGCGVLSETISNHIPYLLKKVLAIISECDCDNG